MNSLQKSSEADVSISTTHVEKERIFSTLEMPAYFSQIVPPHLLQVAMILDFGLIVVPLLFLLFNDYISLDTMLFNFGVFKI